jgi:hypothetical protein
LATSQPSLLVLGIAVVALFAGTTIAKRGSALLDKAQFEELKPMFPDPVALMAPAVMLGALYFGAGHPGLTAMVVVVSALLFSYRVPYPYWRSPWPLPARLRLVIGNLVLIVGGMSAALIYIAQRWSATSL